MTLPGKLFRRIRAGERRDPLQSIRFSGGPATIVVTSPAFADGAAIPRVNAGNGVGQNLSPPLRWSGVPAEAEQLVLIIDDLDVPLPKPLLHTVALIEPQIGGLGEGELVPGTPGVRFVKAFGTRYMGPRPIKGHGPHRYRFHVFALDRPAPDGAKTSAATLRAMAGHVLARGVLTGTYER